jgi:hypothetical protein
LLRWEETFKNIAENEIQEITHAWMGLRAAESEAEAVAVAVQERVYSIEPVAV